MSQENSHGLSYISRGASLLVVLGVLAGGILAYAQIATEAKIIISTYKNSVTAASNIQIQQILTDTGEVKEYCVSNAAGQCAFVISEKDGNVHFIGAELDKKTGKAVELYGHEIEPNYNCLRVAFRYDSAAGKIYQYVDGIKGDSAKRYTIFAESFYKQRCAPNLTDGYDLIDKDKVEEPAAAKVSPPPSITFKMPTSPPDDSGDFEDVEDEENADNIDIKLTDVVLGSKKLQKKKSTAALGLKLKIAAASNVSDTVVVRAGMDCTLRDGYPNDESWQSWDFKVAESGSQQIFYEFGALDEKWTALKKKKPFMCYVAVSGIVPVDAPLELRQDADASNNRLRFKLFWKDKRWQIGKPETF